MSTIHPTSNRAKTRMSAHTLEVVREGHFQGNPATLVRCTDEDCPNIRKDGSAWTGWFTKDEARVSEN